MRVLITTVNTPFLRGGAEILAEGLRRALRDCGHDAEVFSTPFRFGSTPDIQRSIEWWSNVDLDAYCGAAIDRVIHLKFPCYYAHHSRGVLWLLHQYRAFYELWESPEYPTSSVQNEASKLREVVRSADSERIALIKRRFTISERVSERLLQFNGIESTALYHPPLRADEFYCGDSWPYILCVSRFEQHKRQMLFLEALAQVKCSIVGLLVGEGGYKGELERRVGELDLWDRVRFVTALSHEALRAYYANCRAVFFAPYDEDYGYIALEAMLASKPVITCTDSGGPLEFVEHSETGLVSEPIPEAVADAIDRYADDPLLARIHGSAGRQAYLDRDITWERVVETLLK